MTMSSPEKEHARFIVSIFLEVFLRFVEFVLVSAFLSCLLLVVFNIDIVTDKMALVLRIVFFLLFEVLTIWLCRKSNKRVHHLRFSYYIANISACLVYAFVSFIFTVSNVSISSYIFCVTQTLWISRYTTYGSFVVFFGLFHLITFVLVILAKEFKYMKRNIRRRVRHEKTFYLLDR